MRAEPAGRIPAPDRYPGTRTDLGAYSNRSAVARAHPARTTSPAVS